MLDDVDVLPPVVTPRCTVVSGYRLADGYYYHLGHTWARFEHGGRTRIGLDDFTAKVFGPVDTFRLPPLGADLKQNEVGMTFRRDANEAAVLSPVTGTVLAVNPGASAHPEITHEDPYGSGWLCIVEPRHSKKDAKRLYFGEDSLRWMDHENRLLMQMIGPEYEGLAATGGAVIGDIYGRLGHLEWHTLVERFLRTGMC
jgi:glycine cleavage system H lipoate-binding protein